MFGAYIDTCGEVGYGAAYFEDAVVDAGMFCGRCKRCAVTSFPKLSGQAVANEDEGGSVPASGSLENPLSRNDHGIISKVAPIEMCS